MIPDSKYYEYTRDNINNILISLAVISSIKQNDLVTWDSSGNPNVQVNGPFRKFRRRFTNQSRVVTINYLNTLIYDAIDICNTHSDDTLTTRIRNALILSTHGLVNLIDYYKEDVNTSQGIKLLCNDIINMENQNIFYEQIN